MDPASIVGVIAFPLTAVAFLTDTVGNLERKSRDFKNCQRQLENYRARLQQSQQKIERWQDLWFPPSNFRAKEYCRETYIAIWGKPAFERIGRLLHDAKDLSEKAAEEILGNRPASTSHSGIRASKVRFIQKTSLFRARRQPTQENWIRWQVDARKHRENPEERTTTDKVPDYLTRIAFAVYGNDKLNSYIEDLYKAVSELDNLSKDEIRRAREDEREIGSREIKDLINLTRHYQEVKQFSELIVEAQLEIAQRVQWALKLPAPPKVNLVDLEPIENDAETSFLDPRSQSINFELIAQNAETLPSSRPMRSNLQLLYKNGMSPQSTKAALRPLHNLRDSIRSGVWTKQNGEDSTKIKGLDMWHTTGAKQGKSLSLRSILDDVSSREKKSRNIALRVERAFLAFRFVNWSITLWNTPLMPTVCSCSLRVEKKSSHVEHIALISGRKDCETDTHTVLDERYRLASLGVVLAELALLVPIRVCLKPTVSASMQSKSNHAVDVIDLISEHRSLKPHELELEEREWDEDIEQWNSWKPVYAEDLLSRISHETSYGYRSAVEYCLESVVTRHSDRLIPNRVDQYVEEVLMPIREYVRRVSRHRHALQSQEYRRLLDEVFLEQMFRDVDSGMSMAPDDTDDESDGEGVSVVLLDE